MTDKIGKFYCTSDAMDKQIKHISKFMSLVLRHKPGEIGLEMDEHGWVKTDDLIASMNKKGIRVDMDTINTVVMTNDKQRFAFNEDKTMIRASQGHSIAVDLDLPPAVPPEILYHGTAEHHVGSIMQKGLEKGSRQHLHLSATFETARQVGSRHGKPIVLTIRAKAMHDAGHVFFLSENKVWLTKAVPAEYISL